MCIRLLNSSIGKKQIVAATGLLLIGFVIAHLAGNLFMYGGPGAFNAYARKLASFRPFLYVIEWGLLAVFLIHIYVTILLVWENIQARGGNRYKVYQPVGERSLATRLMPYTGTFILFFVIWHLLDFTFVDHEGPLSIMPDGRRLGLYGIVYNSFCDPLHSIGYIMAMICVGLHLSHGIQSFSQTFGLTPESWAPRIRKISDLIAILITVGYSSIPVYVLIDSMKYKM